MIDRQARTEVRKIVDDFLSDRVGSFAFDDKRWDVDLDTDDQTVKFVTSMLWYTYSNTEDHLVCLNKRSWDTVQRLLLLLDSDCEMRRYHVRKWHSSQAAAATSLIFIGYLAWLSQGQLWLICLLLGGLASMAISKCRQRVRATPVVLDPWRAWPFPSIEAIRRTLRRTPAFQKQKYRREIEDRGNDRPWSFRLPQILEWPLSRIGWCIVSPIILLFQGFPISIEREEFVELETGFANAA